MNGFWKNSKKIMFKTFLIKFLKIFSMTLMKLLNDQKDYRILNKFHENFKLNFEEKKMGRFEKNLGNSEQLEKILQK